MKLHLDSGKRHHITYLVGTPTSKIHFPVMKVKFHVPYCMCKIKTNNAALKKRNYKINTRNTPVKGSSFSMYPANFINARLVCKIQINFNYCMFKHGELSINTFHCRDFLLYFYRIY